MKRENINQSDQQNKIYKESAMKKLIIALLALCLFAVPASLMANGTKAGGGITNAVVVAYSNAGDQPYNASAFATNRPVQAVLGLSGFVSNMCKKFVAPGSSITYSVIITNKGNTNSTIALTNYLVKSNTLGGIFTFNFYTNVNTNGGRIKYLNLAEDQSHILFLYVSVSGLATNNSILSNIWGTHISNVATSMINPLQTYLGMDGLTTFGGRDFYTNSWAYTVVQAPVLNIEKRSSVTNSSSYKLLTAVANWKKVVPGSQIVYVITWTNAGSGLVKRLNFTDPVKSAQRYVPNSMVFTNGLRIQTGYFAAWTNAWNSPLRRLADNGSTPRASFAAWYGINGKTNVTAGITNVTFRYTNATVNGLTAGTLMYKVNVK